ncbi:hypothetical protein M3O57_14210 [Xanthomonas nasturtii]|uniref:Uncharacterized protein n=1 Tax=Xanthomonas nasturtii TaxID=1843581 RepID=A0A3E1KGX5_9XANT|nr:hypothetical protein [Xanthomonas nasturtii]MCL1531395.1 hypothetical protein [Xanthomonas nasturtii]MCL1553220.1 hypothetical protein [Xanthomonas nasturtii]MCL1557308.1 hypothetical protein [Xanthomonas nasturtii]MCL1566172.1 hypothetical protein [Xanthomonas nasturtii]MCL1570228.1 hypothetical protein [Xanthomonas nasturtii]
MEVNKRLTDGQVTGFLREAESDVDFKVAAAMAWRPLVMLLSVRDSASKIKLLRALRRGELHEVIAEFVGGGCSALYLAPQV